MLSITRREGQILNFYTKDGIVKVHISFPKNGQVRLGLDLPDTVQVMRDEIDDGLHSLPTVEDRQSSVQELATPKISFARRVLRSIGSLPFNAL